MAPDAPAPLPAPAEPGQGDGLKRWWERSGCRTMIGITVLALFPVFKAWLFKQPIDTAALSDKMDDLMVGWLAALGLVAATKSARA